MLSRRMQGETEQRITAKLSFLVFGQSQKRRGRKRINALSSLKSSCQISEGSQVSKVTLCVQSSKVAVTKHQGQLTNTYERQSVGRLSLAIESIEQNVANATCLSLRQLSTFVTCWCMKPINSATRFSTSTSSFYKFKFLLMRCHGDLISDPYIQDIFPAPEEKNCFD